MPESANFIKIGPTVCEIVFFFDFSRWQPLPSWILKFLIFYWLMVSGGPRCFSTPNFVEISQCIVEI